jgi:hypothetical protein
MKVIRLKALLSEAIRLREGLLTREKRPKNLPSKLKDLYQLHDKIQSARGSVAFTRVSTTRSYNQTMSLYDGLLSLKNAPFVSRDSKAPIDRNLTTARKKMREAEDLIHNEIYGGAEVQLDHALYYLHSTIDYMAEDAAGVTTEGIFEPQDRPTNVPASIKSLWQLHDKIQGSKDWTYPSDTGTQRLINQVKRLYSQVKAEVRRQKPHAERLIMKYLRDAEDAILVAARRNDQIEINGALYYIHSALDALAEDVSMAPFVR